MPSISRVRGFCRCMMPTMALLAVKSESELQAQLQATLNVIPAYTWYALPSGTLTFVNERTANYLGLPKDHPLRFGIDTGASWDSHIPLLHPDDQEESRRVWSTCLRTGRAGEVSFRVRNAQGGYRWFLSRAEPLRAGDGTLLYWIGVDIEIEERKQAEFYLAEGERLAHMGSWVFDPAGFFDYWSRELFHIYGLDPAKEGPSLEEYLACIHPQDREFMRSLIKRMIAEASGCDVTKRIVRPNSELRYIRCVGIPVVENGVLQRIVGTAMDVTEHELLTKELRRREAYLAEAQRLSQTGSFGWKPESGEIVWSDETYRIFEYDHAVKPRIDLLVQRVHPEDRPYFLKVIESASEGATQFEHTYRWLLPDGSVKHVHAAAHALQDASGNREFVGAATDVTWIKRAEDELRKSEAYLAEAQRLSQTGSWAWSPASDNAYYSEECYRLLGFEPHGPPPPLETVIQRIHPDDQADCRERVEKGVRDKVDFELGYRIIHPDKRVRDIRCVCHPVLDPSRDLIELVGTVIDITERKRAEEELRRKEAYLAEAQRLSQTGSWAWNPATDDIRYWSEECFRVLGFDPQAPPPRFETFFQRIHPDDQARCRERFGKAISEKADFELDYRIVHPDKGVRDIHVVGHPVLSTSGHLVEFVGTVIDVTERKQAEDELRRSEAELRQMLDLAPQLVAVFGPARERLYANRVALDYLGVSLEKWRQTPDMGEFIHPDDRARVHDFYYGALSRGTAYELEFRLRKDDGSYRWFLTRYNPLRDEHGKITRWYVACTDIEDRKLAEEKLQHENITLREEVDQTSMFEEIIGTSPALQAVLARVSKVAPSDSTVLVTGETGTGKELIARAIHRRSRRMSRAFVSVNCAAIPRDLIASELFGHEKGAFTGATQRRLGRFELADGGTIFLDEVGELLPDTQVALLRVLQERELERVGGGQPIRVDVRVIAATNRDLHAAVANETFRQDLFYRLNVFPIQVPALRERKEDILMLVEYFVQRYANKAGKNICSIDKKTLDLLQAYDWPGNIRELQNVIERSVILSTGEVFSVDELWLSQGKARPTSRFEALRPLHGEVEPRTEREIIEATLAETKGRVSGPSGAAAKLGVPPSTLDHRIKALKINKKQFKFR
jgi:formate hydrogenlyase transcriptional activator